MSDHIVNVNNYRKNSYQPTVISVFRPEDSEDVDGEAPSLEAASSDECRYITMVTPCFIVVVSLLNGSTPFPADVILYTFTPRTSSSRTPLS